MSRFCDRPFLRLATIGALVAALGLAACGRKGPLDPPPSASVTGEPRAQNSGLLNPIGTAPIGGSRASQGDLAIGPNGQPMAPAGPKKTIPLDVLLN